MAKKLAGALILVLSLNTGALAATPSPVVAATPPQPTWRGLSTEQQTVLAPLAGEWDRMENYRRKKWLGIAQRYRTMKPEEQQRLQEKMRDWARLTPEQRLAAREKFKEFNQMSPQEKATVRQKWQEYNQLSEDDRRRAREPNPVPPANPGEQR